MSDIEFVYPKNPLIVSLVKKNKKRSMALDNLKGPKGQCKWCLTPMENSRKKYCSTPCKESAWAFFYPQKYAYKFLSKRQSGKCAHCEYDFSSEIKKFSRTVGGYKEEYFDRGDVDHIIPIHQGGEILGIENLQLLCKDCHKVKSAEERRNSTPKEAPHERGK